MNDLDVILDDGVDTAVAEPSEEVQEQPPETPAAEETPEQVEERKKKTGSQRAKEKAQRLAEENEMLRRMLLDKEQQKPKEAAPVQTEGKPRQDDYETHAEWVEAVTDWKVDQKLKEREAKAESEKRQSTWEGKAKEARAEYEDFDEALESAPAPSRAVAEVLAESPLGAKLAYHLATHAEDYSRINKLNPIAAARELGLIEASITRPKSNPAAPAAATKAPKPPTPITATAAAKPADDGRLVTY